MNFATRIRTLRKDAGITQQTLAVRAGLSITGLCMLERGVRTHPRYSTLEGIAKGLGISVSQLVEEE